MHQFARWIGWAVIGTWPLIGGAVDAATAAPWMAAGYQNATPNRYGVVPQIDAVTNTGAKAFTAPPGYDIVSISWTSWGDQSGTAATAMSANAQFEFYAGTTYLTSTAMSSGPGAGQYVGLMAPPNTTAFRFFLGGQSSSQSREELYITHVGLAPPGQWYASRMITFATPPRVIEGSPAKKPWFYP